MSYLELAEKRSHGTPDFPAEYYYIDESHPRYVMQAHWHKEFELIRVLSGRLTVYLNNVKHELASGDCLFVEGGCLKCGYPDACIYECLVFDLAMLKRRRMTERERSFFDGSSTELCYKNLLRREERELLLTVDGLMRSAREAVGFYELEVVGRLCILLSQLYSAGYITRREGGRVDKRLAVVTSLLEWIENNLSEPISLSELARVGGRSEKYLCRIFKLYTSKTLTEYINERRIEKACADMERKSITEAAFDCGFNDLSYFCKIFKRYKGISPSEYRRRYLSARRDG